eukprot:jgi/Bigna1/89404/estExt_fgenesh1_pg.C_480133
MSVEYKYNIRWQLVNSGNQDSVFHGSALYKPKMKLEVLSSRGVRVVLVITYMAAITGVVITAVPTGVDSAIDRFLLVPSLAIGYTFMVYLFLRYCMWECLGLVLREQVWTFLTLCVCAVCALEVAVHTFQEVPAAGVTAARVALQNVQKLLWLMMMDSFGRKRVVICSRFYRWKVLFVTCNVVAEAVTQSLCSKYSPEDMAVTWSNLTGVLLIQHIYMCVIGYIHLPITRQEAHVETTTIQSHLNKGHCSFYAAKMCLQASYEVYQESPYNSPDSAISEQWIKCGGWAAPRNMEVVNTFRYQAVGMQVVIVSISAPSMTIVAFRGTDNWKNVVTDLATWRIAPSRFGPGSRPDCLSDANVKVHKGFWSAYQSMRRDLLEQLRAIYRPDNKAITNLHNPETSEACDAPIVFTGHSLGGALATLAALDNATLVRPLHHLTALFTFGSPRVGSYAFASLFDRKVPEAMRLVFERDMVTNQPKFCCAYKHVGREILVDERGNCIANPTFVEKAFSNSKTRISDHSMFAYLRGMKACEISGIDHGDGDYER